MNPLAYDFMRTAYLAAVVVAILSGMVGHILVLRNQAFAGHALGHVGFAGATLALLLGFPPISGLIVITVAGGAAMGLLGRDLQERDIGIGMVLATALGFGLLFLGFLTRSATQATSLLFGNVLAVDRQTLLTLGAVTALSLAALALTARPLLFASLQPELAEASGVRLRALAMGFLAITGLAVAATAQIVGVLLVFTLMIAPAAAAQRLTARLAAGIALTVTLAILQAILGITLAFYTDWPVSFWITALGAATYIAALASPASHR